MIVHLFVLFLRIFFAPFVFISIFISIRFAHIFLDLYYIILYIFTFRLLCIPFLRYCSFQYARFCHHVAYSVGFSLSYHLSFAFCLFHFIFSFSRRSLENNDNRSMAMLVFLAILLYELQKIKSLDLVCVAHLGLFWKWCDFHSEAIVLFADISFSLNS